MWTHPEHSDEWRQPRQTEAACMMAWCPAPQPSAWPDLTYLWWPRTTTKTRALVTSSSTLQHPSTSGNCCVNICEKGNAKRCNGNLIHRFVAGTGGTCKDTKGHSTRGVLLRHSHTQTHTYMYLGTHLYYICSVLYLRIEGRQLTQILVCAGLIESCGWEG